MRLLVRLRCSFLCALAGASVCLLLPLPWARAQGDGLPGFHGLLVVDGNIYSGTAGLKFVLVNTADTHTFWSNDGTSIAGGEPEVAVTISVDHGIYGLIMGDTRLANMTELPEDVFASSEDVWLRVWFDDGVHGSQRLSPELRLGGQHEAPLTSMVPASSVFSTRLSMGILVNADSLVGGTAGACQVVGGTVATAVSINPCYAFTGISALIFNPPRSVTNIGDMVSLSGAESGRRQVTPGDSQSLADNYVWTRQASLSEGNWQAVACSADGLRLAVAQDDGGIYVSDNAGATWKETTAPRAHWYTVASSADGRRLVTAQGIGRIYRSSDAGLTWKKTSAPNGDWKAVTSSANGKRLVAIGFLSLYVSADAGLTWKKTSAPVAGWYGVATSADGKRLVAAHVSVDAGASGIYVSSDAGSTWTPTNAPVATWQGVASSADGSRLIAVQYSGGIYVSNDYGSTWTKTGAPKSDWQGVASSADGSRLIAAQYSGSIYVSANGGSTWAKTRAPDSLWQAVAISADGTRLVAGAWAYGGSGVYTAQ